MTAQWYFRRIRNLFAEIGSAIPAVLPANRKIAADFVHSWEVCVVEDLLGGLRDVEQWDDMDWEDDAIFLKFKDHVLDTEAKMERGLRAVKYCIDAANTLIIVAGDGRPERVSASKIVVGPSCDSYRTYSISCHLYSSCCAGLCPSYASGIPRHSIYWNSGSFGSPYLP